MIDELMLYSEIQRAASGKFSGLECAVTYRCGNVLRGAASEAEEPPTPLVWLRPWNLTKRFTMENLSNSWHSSRTSNVEPFLYNLKHHENQPKRKILGKDCLEKVMKDKTKSTKPASNC